MCHDNAVSTLGKLWEHHSELMDVGAVAAVWVAALPLLSDAIEAQVGGTPRGTRAPRLCGWVRRWDRGGCDAAVGFVAETREVAMQLCSSC